MDRLQGGDMTILKGNTSRSIGLPRLEMETGVYKANIIYQSHVHSFIHFLFCLSYPGSQEPWSLPEQPIIGYTHSHTKDNLEIPNSLQHVFWWKKLEYLQSTGRTCKTEDEGWNQIPNHGGAKMWQKWTTLHMLAKVPIPDLVIRFKALGHICGNLPFQEWALVKLGMHSAMGLQSGICSENLGCSTLTSPNHTFKNPALYTGASSCWNRFGPVSSSDWEV